MTSLAGMALRVSVLVAMLCAVTAAAALAAPKTVTSGDGMFTTVVPAGFTDQSSREDAGLDYLAAIPKQGLQITVFARASRGVTDVKAIAQKLRKQDRSIDGHGFSPIRLMKVGGRPAASWTFMVTMVGHDTSASRGEPKRIPTRWRRVVVVHGFLFYTITYSGPAKPYEVHAPGFAQVLEAWHWTS